MPSISWGNRNFSSKGNWVKTSTFRFEANSYTSILTEVIVFPNADILK